MLLLAVGSDGERTVARGQVGSLVYEEKLRVFGSLNALRTAPLYLGTI